MHYRILGYVQYVDKMFAESYQCMYPNKLCVLSKAELCKLAPKRDIVFCTRLFTEIFYRIEHSSNVCDHGE